MRFDSIRRFFRENLAMGKRNNARRGAGFRPCVEQLEDRLAPATFSVVHSLAGSPSDGSFPQAVLIADAGGDLFGTTGNGGASNNGTVFELVKSGGGYVQTILHNFAGGAADGASPAAGVIADAGGDLFGTTDLGGASGKGTVFELVKSGSNYTATILHSFAGGPGDGANPFAGLTADVGGDLFGTTYQGGASGLGTVFELVKSGGSYNYSILHSFPGGTSDGANTQADLIVDRGGNVFGTTVNGGASNFGTVFELAKSGLSYTLTILHSFAGGTDDGSTPFAGVIADAGGDLFGTTDGGGASDLGTVFELVKSGNNYTPAILHSFAGGAADGVGSEARPIADARGDLFGTTSQGAANNDGTVFELFKTGTGYTPITLHVFMAGQSDGAQPFAGLLADANGNLFGTTATGGPTNNGTVFELTGVLPQHTVGVFDPNNAVFHLSNVLNNPGAGDIAFQYGGFQWKPIVGNFSGTGVSTPGVFDPNNAIFHLSNTLGNPGAGDIAFQYGGNNWIPIAGNFFGLGHDTVGVFDPVNAIFHLSNVLGNPGAADYAFQYGGNGWIPIVGDFFGLGHDTIGVFDPVNAIFHLSNVLGNPGAADYAFQYGGNGWKPIAGDFAGSGKATIGVFDPTNAIFHISKVLNNPGAGDIAFPYGGNQWVPLAGDWDFPVLPQLAAGGEASVPSGTPPLTESQLQTEVQTALNLLAANGVSSALLGKLRSLQFTVGSLPAGYLGLSNMVAGQVEISADAAGYGWFVDANPSDSPAADRMDLLTVVLHEMGHFDGWTELDPATHPDALMALTLGTGQRRIQALDAVFGSSGQ